MLIEGDTISVVEGEKWDASVMKVNMPHEYLRANIAANIRAQVPQFTSYAESPDHIALVGGGWSLAETLQELRELYHSGVKVAALNGSAKWLYEQNIRPSLHIVLDSRADNLQFLRPSIPGCKVFLASQVHPSLVQACKDDGRDLTIFHAIAENGDEDAKMLDEFYLKRWLRIPAAGTVGCTSIMLLRLLGFRFQHVFGLDSCYAPSGKHHSYAQSLNDNEGTAVFKIAGREFVCSAWQASQAQNFMDLLKVNGQFIELQMYGDGMLGHIVKTGADLMESVERTAA